MNFKKKLKEIGWAILIAIVYESLLDGYGR